MKAPIPYLTFNGVAEEALALYAKAFNGSVVEENKFRSMPDFKDEFWGEKIMHAIFKAGDLTIMVSDTRSPEEVVQQGTNMALSFDFDTAAEMERVFTVLSDDANIIMPLQNTFWGARFGILVDKFGIHWMFNHDYKK